MESQSEPRSQRLRPAARRPKSHRSQRGFVERNRSLLLAGVGVIVIGALIVMAVLQAGGSGQAPADEPSAAADPSVVAAVTSLPQSLFDSVGQGSAGNPPTKVAAAPASASVSGPQARPRLLFVGGEFCPYCAAQRWPLIIALSRFGSFEGLSSTRSSAQDVYPSTATLSFYGSTYESPYFSFEPVEIYSNQKSGGGYASLERLNDEQAAINQQYNPGGGIPFLYVDGLYVLQGANFNPALLTGMDWSQVAAAIQQPDSKVASAVIGSANLLTAAICQVTGGQPAEVCQSAGVLQATEKLPQ